MSKSTLNPELERQIREIVRDEIRSKESIELVKKISAQEDLDFWDELDKKINSKFGN